MDRQLETLDDFDDYTSDIRGQEKRNGHAQLSHSATLSKIATQVKRAKVGEFFYMVFFKRLKTGLVTEVLC